MTKGFDRRIKVETVWFDFLQDGKKFLLGRSLKPTPSKPCKGHFFVGAESLTKAYGFDFLELCDCIGEPLACIDTANGKEFKAWDGVDFFQFIDQKAQKGDLTAIKIKAMPLLASFLGSIKHRIQIAENN